MKKNLIFLWILFTLISCKKETVLSTNTESDVATKIEITTNTLMSLVTANARKNAFATQLNNSEKANYYKDRLAQVTSDLKLNQDQIVIVSELIKFLKPDVYQTGSSLNKEFLAFEPSWLERATKLIDKDQIKYIFSYQTFEEFNNSKVVQTVKVMGGGCQCASQSDYCWGSSCFHSYGCDYSNSGCGTIGLYVCDGLCGGVSS